ncbi:hypothetical protein C2845_PM14G20170 [Panicum miliaceum]|uniref:Uncharacterized protein n=1 Tax=Panicum miliaceum TaxID=4540 RepID=A0A3L6PRM1_PANMI|nr:hypothetical protein C2845_PM14G20170 [Panicum miliaceum]
MLRGPAAFALEFMDAGLLGRILCRRRGRGIPEPALFEALRRGPWTPVASRASTSSRTTSSPTPAAAAADGRKICNMGLESLHKDL